MKKINFTRGLIVGPSGIGAVHLREFLRMGFNEIGFIGKSKFKKRTFNISTRNLKDIKIINLQNFKNIKKFQPQVTSICSPFTQHENHILKCKNYSKFIIVEKPFIWSGKKLKKGKNFQISSDILSKSNNTIVVNLPMISLAKQLIYKKEIPKNIKIFKFFYFTKGKQTYENIAVDLLPHALSFLLSILKKKTFNTKIIAIRKQKSKWSCRIKLDETLCIFQFKQDSAIRESILNFDINNNQYKRFQENVNEERVNYLIKNKKKKLFLKNPMTDYLLYLIKNSKKTDKIKMNNNLVLKIIKIKEDLLAYNNF